MLIYLSGFNKCGFLRCRHVAVSTVLTFFAGGCSGCVLFFVVVFAEVIRVSQQTLTRAQHSWSLIIRLGSSHL